MRECCIIALAKPVVLGFISYLYRRAGISMFRLAWWLCEAVEYGHFKFMLDA